MNMILSVACFVAAVILLFKGNVDRASVLLIVSGLYSVASVLYLIWSEIKTVKDLIKDKILAEKTMAAIYKSVKERSENDGK